MPQQSPCASELWMTSIWDFTLILMVFLILSISPVALDICHPTSITQWTCSGQGLTSVPVVNQFVRVLDLSNNNLTVVSEDSFQRHLILIELNLSYNTMKRIHVLGFTTLPSLQIIDLSNNHLNFIHPCTFYYNTKIERIILRKNPLRHLDYKSPILVSMSLHLLYLNYEHFSIDNFAELPNLGYLYLNYNTSQQPMLGNNSSAFERQNSNIHCDLRVTWQCETACDEEGVECWLRTKSKANSDNYCTIHLFEDSNITNISTHYAPINDSVSTPSPEDFWSAKLFSFKHYLITMLVLFVCVMTGIITVHNVLTYLEKRKERCNRSRDIEMSNDHIYEEIAERNVLDRIIRTIDYCKSCLCITVDESS